MRVCKFLLEDVQQTERCLARTRRTDNEKEVARLLGSFHKRIESAILAPHVYVFVNGGLSLAEDKVASLLRCGQKAVHGAVESA